MVAVLHMWCPGTCQTCQPPTPKFVVPNQSVFFTVLDGWLISVLVLSHLVQKKWPHQPKMFGTKCHWGVKICHGQKTCLKLTQPNVEGYPCHHLNLGEIYQTGLRIYNHVWAHYELIFENFSEQFGTTELFFWL